ncbi:hypothetical protein U1Q18_031023 [Sarracenia purpurea var. burkii]
MASTDKPAAEPEAPEKATPLSAAPAQDLEKVAPPPEDKLEVATRTADYFVVADVVLRVLLFASTVTAVVVIVTSKQTKLVPVSFPPFRPVPRPAKFVYSPAFVYFVTALSVASLYSIITTVVSFLALVKQGFSTKFLAHFVIFDVLILGIVAAATGVAGGVAYIGLKGNSHLGWTKVCNVYDKFCQHLGASIAVSLFASIVLALLVVLSVYSLSKKIPK